MDEIVTKGWTGYDGLENHNAVAIRDTPAHKAPDWTHRVFSNLKCLRPRRPARLPVHASGLAARGVVVPIELAKTARRQLIRAVRRGPQVRTRKDITATKARPGAASHRAPRTRGEPPRTTALYSIARLPAVSFGITPKAA